MNQEKINSTLKEFGVNTLRKTNDYSWVKFHNNQSDRHLLAVCKIASILRKYEEPFLHEPQIIGRTYRPDLLLLNRGYIIEVGESEKELKSHKNHTYPCEPVFVLADDVLKMSSEEIEKVIL